MTVERVQIHRDIQAPLERVFDWFYQSEHFVASPIVFRSSWRSASRWTKGSQRDIVMIAGWYAEQITAVIPNQSIRYQVTRSFPPVRQEFTELAFEKITEGRTKVTWTIEIDLPLPVGKRLANHLAGKMAKLLYATILTAGKRALEEP